MDALVTPSPAAITTATESVIESDFVKVPELDARGSPILRPSDLPPPPPLTPAPSTMDEVESSPVLVVNSVTTTPPPPSVAVGFQPIVPPPPSSNGTTTSTGLQMMTRKRSMSAANNGMPVGGASSNNKTNGGPSLVDVPGTASCLEPKVAPVVSDSCDGNNLIAKADAPPPQPPKKKKKYIPKPKKSPETTAKVVGNNASVPSKPSNSSKTKATKTPEAVLGSTCGTSGLAVDAAPPTLTSSVENPGAVAAKPAKPKRPSKPKAPKKPSSSSSSSKSKSKKAKPPVTSSTTVAQENAGKATADVSNGTAFQQPLVPPLKLVMPKLKKMPGASNDPPASTMPILPMKLKVKKQSGVVWVENGDHLDPSMAEPELNEDGSEELTNGKGSSRKKKSKGRNGNIYIGVFNRIEWMKLQSEFGFGTVNNFGTFVLQTMRRVHGDIQFWCDIAVASGVYPELDHYEWINGFPQAINKDGQHFAPEPDITMTDKKREEVVELARGMWEQRLQQLKQQQQDLTGEEEVLPEGEDEEEEDEDAMPGLENYLENMASGQYSPSSLGGGSGGGAGQSTSAGAPLTEEEVNKIWNQQMSDSDSLEKFGKLFSFINSIATMGKRQVSKDDGQTDELSDNLGVSGIGAGEVMKVHGEEGEVIVHG